MKHFTTEKWIDFVNQVMTGSEKDAMRKHLEQGCKRCAETVSLWQRVRQTAPAQAKYMPPEDTVRVVKSAFAGAALAGRRKGAPGRIAVLFDSFLQPALGGARSAGTGTRQMLYRADPYQVDMQIEAKPEGNRLIVTGQLLDISHPDIVGRDVQVTLSNRRGNVVHTQTNQFGEFRGEIEDSGDLELSFPNPGEKSIVISLRDALGQLPGSKG